MSTPSLTLVGTLEDILGNPDIKARVKVTLCGLNGAIASAGGNTLADWVETITPDSTGAISQPIWGNDVILPSGTFYLFQFIDGSGNVVASENYRLDGAGTVNISSLIPITPIPPVPTPPQGILDVVPCTPTANFDCSTYTAFSMTISQNVTAPTFSGVVAGQLYAVTLLENGVGGFEFLWPANVLGAPVVDTAANERTTLLLMGVGSGNLQAVGLGAYYP